MIRRICRLVAFLAAVIASPAAITQGFSQFRCGGSQCLASIVNFSSAAIAAPEIR